MAQSKNDMMRQWKSVKAQHEDCIVLFRLGDFYEMFYEDAELGSKLLGLTLTGKSCGDEVKAPMCGIPYHTVDTYIAKLVEKGKKVAICEQLTRPGEQRGLVQRGVVRIITSGTMEQPDKIDEKSNNFIASVCGESTAAAVAWADLTTGEFFVEEISPYNAERLNDVLVRINPAEIICSSSIYSLADQFVALGGGRIPRFTLYKDYAYSYANAKNAVLKNFKAVSLEPFIPTDSKLCISAAGALFEYFSETHMRELSNVEKIEVFDEKKRLRLDATALNNLEIVRSMRDGKAYGTLFWAIDKTRTSMGSRMLKSFLTAPLVNAEAINYRLDAVDDLYQDSMTREGICELLDVVGDLERLAGKLANGIITTRDMVALKSALSVVPSLKMQLAGHTSKALCDISDNLGDYSDVCGMLSAALNNKQPAAISDGGVVKPGFSAELDHQRELQSNANKFVTTMEAKERERTGIRTLKISSNKIFGYYIEISNSFKEQVPYNYIRKQTLVNGERYITEELKNFEEEVMTCEQKIYEIESDIVRKLENMLLENLSSILRTAKCMAFLDVMNSFAEIARKQCFVRPKIVGEEEPLNIVGGRHPVVEAVSKDRFVPNDTRLDLENESVMIITGPNMAGKSTFMRQVALITILAQSGAFVPAKSAEIPIVDKIYTRVGASDCLILDQSTFMVEMTEVAKILRGATRHSLIIMDEVGRGTSTYDGLSIAWAVVEYIASSVHAKTLFATHYHEISELEGVVAGVTNYKISVKEVGGEIVFLRKVTRGSANKSFGIEVAALAGIPEEVTRRAKKILKGLEKNDTAIRPKEVEEVAEELPQKSEVERILRGLDLNGVTPLKAFEILINLKEKAEADE